MSIITALIFGATWWNEGSIDTEVASLKQVQNIIGNLYTGLSFLGALPATCLHVQFPVTALLWHLHLRCSYSLRCTD